MSKLDKISDINSEAGIIATLIKHPDYLLYSETLQPNHFYDFTNSCLYWGIRELYNQNIANIDVYNLANILNSKTSVKNYMEQKITEGQLRDLISLSVEIARDTAEEYKQLVHRILELAYKRKTVESLQNCEKLCISGEGSIKDIQKNIYDTLDKMSDEFTSTDEIPSYSEKARELWQETIQRQGKTFGLEPKFPSASKYFTYEKGELILVSAYRKEGKSMFCLNEAIDKLNKGIGVVYFDTEMNDRLFNERLICHLSGVRMNKIKTGQYSQEETKKIEEALLWIEDKKNFFHIYIPVWSPEELYLTTKKLQRSHGIEFFIMDYFKTHGSGDASTAYFELGNAVNFVKNEILGELNISGLGAAQLNRGGEIGDSFKIEQYASTILNLKRKTQEEIISDTAECGNYKLFVKLNRLGEQMDDITKDYIDLYFDGNKCEFKEAEKQHETLFESKK